MPVVAAVLALPTSALAQVKVITSGGFAAAYNELLPAFEESTGISVMTTRGASQGNGPNTIGARLRRGVPEDVVIMSRAGLDELISEGRISAGTVVNLAHVPLGIAVRAGTRRPQIGTATGLKQTLLRAKSVAYQSTTVPYMRNKLLPQLGITDEVLPKTIDGGAPVVARGQAEIVIAPVSELLHAPGADYVGPVPPELQYIQTFSAAVVAGSKVTNESKRLIEFLKSENAWAAIRDSGMEPSRSP